MVDEEQTQSGPAKLGLAASMARRVGGLWPPRWAWSARLARTRVPALVSLIPILGYAIILSDEFHAAAMRFEQLGGGIWSSSVGRIHQLYMGSVLVLFGLVVYWMFCPRSIQSYVNARHYIDAMVNDGAPRKLADVHERITAAEPRHPRPRELVEALALIASDGKRYLTYRDSARMHQARIAFDEHWRIRDREYPALSLASIVLMGSGLVLVALPSVEVFFMALRKIVGT